MDSQLPTERAPELGRAARNTFARLTTRVAQLKQRAELKMHLGLMDAEQALEALRPKIEDLNRAAKHAGHDAEHAARVAAAEIGRELTRIGRTLSRLERGEDVPS